MKTIIFWLGRLLLAGIFGYAAVLKLFDPAAFAAHVGHYHLLPHALTLVVAVYLPWLELFCAVALLLRWRERGALLVLLTLCLLFSLALASAWWRGLDIDCGCFGESGASTPPAWALLRSLSLGAVAYALLRISRKSGLGMKTEKPADRFT